jgi:autotransporter-associated beta strand protein
VALLPAAGWGVPSLSFVSASDTHYEDPNESNDLERVILATCNTVTSRTLSNVAVRGMRGIMVPGDLLNTGTTTQWTSWAADFGLNGADGRIPAYPVYEVFGGSGHDGAAMPTSIAARNTRRFGLTAANSGNYSWDWNGIHFVVAGVKAGVLSTDADRVFLANDLATHVGTSGRPVVLLEHENAGNLVQSLYDEVLKNYNVILILNGHQAGGAPVWNGIQTLSGNAFPGGYWLVQINGTTLRAGRTKGGSGNLTASVTRTVTYPTSVTWATAPSNGAWDRPAIWNGGVTPQANGDYASVVVSAATALTLERAYTLSGLTLETSGGGGVSLGAANGSASLTLQKTAGAVMLHALGNHSLNLPVELANDAAVWVDHGSQLDLNGRFNGSAKGLAKAGQGKLVLNVANTYSGATVLSAGVCQLVHPSGVPGGIGATGGTSALTIQGGVLELTDTDFLRPLGTDAAAVSFLGPGGFASLGNAGDRTVNFGNSGAAVTWGAGNFVPTGAALRLSSSSGALRFANPIQLGTATGKFEVIGGTARLDGGVSGTGGIEKIGAGTLVLPRLATFTGPVAITAGTLQLGASDVSGPSNNFTLAGSISGGALVKEGDTTVTLGAANSHATTTVARGTLRLNHRGALGYGVSIPRGASLPTTAVASGGTLDVNGQSLGCRITLSGGALVNQAASAATLAAIAGVTTSAGGEAIPAGTGVALTGGGGSGATVSASFGLTPQSFSFTSAGIEYQIGDILYITGGGGSGARIRLTSGGGVTTNWTLIDPGSGYTSAPTGVVGGEGSAGYNGRGAAITGNAQNFQVASLTLTASGGGYTSMPSVTLAAGSGFTAVAVASEIVLTSTSSIGGTGELNVNASISGAGGLTKTGSGTTTLAGLLSYSGDTRVEAGTLVLTAAALADAADVGLASGSVLMLNTGATDTIDELFLDGVAQKAGEWGAPGSGAANTTAMLAGTGRLRVTTGPASPLASWLAANNVPAAQQQPGADPDSDGQPNFLEYALDSNPSQPGSHAKVFHQFTPGDNSRALTLTVAVRDGVTFQADGNRLRGVLAADSLTYIIEAAEVLGLWGSHPLTEVGALEATTLHSQFPAPSPGWSLRSFRLSGSPTTHPNTFMRVQVTNP